MKTPDHVLNLLVLFALVAFSFSPLVAAQDEPSDERSDPPARAARLQEMSGSVSVQPHGTDDWVAGVLNRPLTNADNIWADKNSRAEISVGTGLIRIDSETSLTLTNVSENAVQLQLHQGAMNLHVRRLYDNETYEVDTPNQAFTVQKPGDYRFDVDSEGDKTVVTVWRGQGESTGDGPAVPIQANQQARFSNGTSMTSDIHSAPAPDDFDEWARNRDERLDHSESARYVSPDVVGYEDLDEYGTWHNTPEYGAVWVPSGVAVGWAPYRFGHWIWVSPWGWTWIEDEPWGYAPFHYGRWVYSAGYWGWAPGPIYVRPYYAPALVAWFGGPSFGVSVGFGGGYGWCPLGWGEPFVPWYHVSRGYFSSVNITNTRITNITNIYNNTYIHHPAAVGGYNGNGLRYANLRAPNGFTAVPRNALINSEPVARSALRISPNQLSRVSPVHNLNISPTRNTMLGANARRPAAVPPPSSFARPTVNRISSRMGNVRSVRGPGETIPNGGRGTMNSVRMGQQQANASRVIPRPPRPGMDNAPGARPGSAGSGRPYIGRGTSSSIPTPTYNQRAGGMNVPRPPYANMPSGYSAAERQGWNGSRPSSTYQANGRPSPYSGGSYSRQMPSYSGGYGRQTPSYSGGGRQTPSYSGGGGRQTPSYSGGYGRQTPSYGGGGSYGRSAPSYDRGSSGRSMPAYGGGSWGRLAPSYGESRAPSAGPAYGGGRPSGGGGGNGGGGGSSRGGGGSGERGRH